MNSALHQLVVKQRQKNARRLVVDFQPPHFDRPLIIVSAPRAGSTLLFETLAHFPELWTIGEESHEIIEGLPALHPAAHGYISNRLTAADAPPAIIAALQDRFARQLRNRAGQTFIELPAEERPTAVRLLEKTPKNALRIPFLRALFPDARLLFLYREPAANIGSMIEGWQSGRFIAYRTLPGWSREPWSFLLTPGWAEMQEKSFAAIAAQQWQVANATILADLAALPAPDWLLVDYADLVRDPKSVVAQIAHFAELTWDAQVAQRLVQPLPISRVTLSAPSADKWQIHAPQITPLLPALTAVVQQVAAIKAAAVDSPGELSPRSATHDVPTFVDYTQ